LVQGRDLQNRQGIFQVNVESGEAKAVVFGEGITANVQWSPDGKKIYFGRNNAFVERDLTSGTERDVYKSNDRRAGGLLSPDGQSLAVRNTDAAAKTTAILLVNVADGRPRELLKLAQPEGIARGEWTPDSSAVIIDKTTGVRHELWLVPVRNGQPRKLDIDPELWLKGATKDGQRGFSLSPDGHKLAFQVGSTEAEIWALENFLPVADKRK
jgi:Tol biopolymer transport system component